MVPISGPDFTPPGSTDLLRIVTAPATLSAELTFSVDATGRVFGIAAPVQANAGLNDSMNEDNQATLAAWRFSPEPRQNCLVRITYEAHTIEAAPVSMLAAYYGANRATGPVRALVQSRLAGPESDCDRARPTRSNAAPDFTGAGRGQGVQEWSVVRWDVAADGSATGVETIGSSGSAAFDTDVRRATGATERPAGPAVQGCVYNWFRRGTVLPAPEMPPPPVDPDRRCPASVLSTFKPMLSPGPSDFAQRGIEGWALVRFDIAPWGEVGSVEVVDSQPAAAFGRIAQDMVKRGRAARGDGAIGCIQPVEFRIVG